MVEMICVLFKINNFPPLLVVGSPYARSTVVTAIKFTISDHPQPIDPLLKGCIGNFDKRLSLEVRIAGFVKLKKEYRVELMDKRNDPKN